MHPPDPVPPDRRDGLALVEVPAGGPVRVPAGQLATALAEAEDVVAVVLWPADQDMAAIPGVMTHAAPLLAPDTVVAQLASVTDALKRVRGDRVVGAVDRTALRRVHAPVVLHPVTARRAMTAAQDGVVNPLDGLGADGRVLPLPQEQGQSHGQ